MTFHSAFFRFVPVTRIEVEWGAYLAGGGRDLIRPGQDYPPHEMPELYSFSWQNERTLPEFQVLLIQAGRGEFESAKTGRQTLSSGALVLLFPGVWHRFRPDPNTGWTERWISFNGKKVHGLFDALGIGPDAAVTLLAPNRADCLAALFDSFLERLHADPLQNSYLLSVRMMALVADALECVITTAGRTSKRDDPGARRTEMDPLVVEALEWIWTHSNRPISVAELARRMAVKRRTLDRRFTKATGHSILAEIQRCRLARAKRLLRETNVPIKAVAHLAGFTNPERLRVAFVENEGLSPSKFRQLHGAGQFHGVSAAQESASDR